MQVAKYCNFQKYESEAYGLSESQPQWIACQAVALHLFPDIANFLYIRKYFPNQNRVELEEMVKNIRNAFKSLLEEANWLDPGTRVKAQLKVRGFP